MSDIYGERTDWHRRMISEDKNYYVSALGKVNKLIYGEK